MARGGLVDIGAEAHFPWPARLALATMVQLRGRLTAAGPATDDEIDRHMANVAAAPMISAWGRRAPSG